jgi:hypothetical protein
MSSGFNVVMEVASSIVVSVLDDIRAVRCRCDVRLHRSGSGSGTSSSYVCSDKTVSEPVFDLADLDGLLVAVEKMVRGTLQYD